MHLKQLLLPLALCFASATAQAETLRWNCTYQTIAKPEGVGRELFKLEFAMDSLTKRAVLLGNNGMSDVEVYTGSQGITFQEKLPTGAVQTTTISKDGSSVHSRHSLMGGRFIPSQYYGKCS